MSFHTLGLRVWPTCDRMLLMAAGRFEEPRDAVTEPVTEEEGEVVMGVIPSSGPPPLDPENPIATDEYDGEPFTTRAVLLAAVCLDTSDDTSGNSWRLAGVGGLTTPGPEEPLALPVPPDAFLTEADTTGAAVECELVAGTWAAANGAFLLVLELVCVVVAQRAVLGMCVEDVTTVLFAVVQLTDVVTWGCTVEGAILVDGQELDKLCAPTAVVVLVVVRV